MLQDPNPKRENPLEYNVFTLLVWSIDNMRNY